MEPFLTKNSLGASESSNSSKDTIYHTVPSEIPRNKQAFLSISDDRSGAEVMGGFKPRTLTPWEEEIRNEVMKEIDTLCEEWMVKDMNAKGESEMLYHFPNWKPQPKRKSDPRDWWFHQSLNTSREFGLRSSLAIRAESWSCVPDIEFIDPLPDNWAEIRKEWMEQPIYEAIAKAQTAKLIPIRLKVNLGNWALLKDLCEEDHGAHQASPQPRRKKEPVDIYEMEENRQNSKVRVRLVLDAIMRAGVSVGLRFRITEVDLSATDSSMRSVFFGDDGLGHKMNREREIEVLDLSYSHTSPRSLVNFGKAVNLKILLLDHCDQLTFTSNKANANVFKYLVGHPIPELEVLSVVGTSNLLAPDWMDQVEKACPKLKVLYFTRHPKEKALGWEDSVMLQTIRDPQLLPCGHLGDKGTLGSLINQQCPICKTPFTTSNLRGISPHITRLIRETSKATWKATVVDHNREPLTSPCAIHLTCGEFYNVPTLAQKYPFLKDQLGSSTPLAQLLEYLALSGASCCSCSQKFEKETMRVFYNSARDQSESFENLEQAAFYTAIGPFSNRD